MLRTYLAHVLFMVELSFKISNFKVGNFGQMMGGWYLVVVVEEEEEEEEGVFLIIDINTDDIYKQSEGSSQG